MRSIRIAILACLLCAVMFVGCGEDEEDKESEVLKPFFPLKAGLSRTYEPENPEPWLELDSGEKVQLHLGSIKATMKSASIMEQTSSSWAMLPDEPDITDVRITYNLRYEHHFMEKGECLYVSREELGIGNIIDARFEGQRERATLSMDWM